MPTETASVMRRDAQGAHIPVIGLGTSGLKGEACVAAVVAALQAGYRHIDTAHMYGNEEAVGEGLRHSGVPRDQIFVTTKVLRENLGAEALQTSAEASLKRLGLDRVDLLLIHWPNAGIPLAESVESLAKARQRGLASHIGVANFPVALLDQAVSIAQGQGEEIAANQCEYHPRLDQSKVLGACRKAGAAFVSYSPLGRGAMLDDPVVVRMAEAHGRTPAQVLLRWHIQQPEVVAIPKSSSPERIAGNLAVFDFELTPDEMSALFALKRPDGRIIKPALAPQWDS